MPCAVELRLDADSEACVRQLWAEASRHFGTDYVFRNGVVPHVALLASDTCLHELFLQLPLTTMQIALDGVGFFSGGRDAFLEVTPSRQLRDYQRACYETAVGQGHNIQEYYAPHRWYPHCTIAQGCTRNLEVPIVAPAWEAQARSLMYVEYPPTTVIAERS